MKKLMILSALASSLILGSCGNDEDEAMFDAVNLETQEQSREAGFPADGTKGGPLDPMN